MSPIFGIAGSKRASNLSFHSQNSIFQVGVIIVTNLTQVIEFKTILRQEAAMALRPESLFVRSPRIFSRRNVITN